MTVAITMEVQGEEEVALHAEQVAERAEDWRKPFREIMDLLERDEAAHFRSLRGRYVLTGETISSLTGSGAGSIREAHRGSLHFGSKVPQATYLSKSPHDPDNEQVRKDSGYLSAVLVFRGATKKRASQIILENTVEPWGD